MKYFLKCSPCRIPNTYWQVSRDSFGWWQAVIYSGNTPLYECGPLPTPAMVLGIMRKNGYEPVDADMPDGWHVLPRHDLLTKDIALLFGVNGNRVTAACKKGLLKAAIGGDGKYIVHEVDAGEWHLASLNTHKKTKPKKNASTCPKCKTGMVKHGTGNAPLICPACYWPCPRC